MSELPLFDDPRRPAGRERRPLDERYQEWKEDHPDTFAMFRRLAWQARRAGADRIGAKAIVERMRWDGMIAEARGHGHDAYKIPNQYTSRIVRDLIEEDPTWAALFETRELKA